jgi:preprotein translocase subunit SecE
MRDMAKATTADSGKAEGKPVKGKGGRAAKADKPNVFARLAQYLRDVRSEMKRVVWPSRPEVINSSVVVIVTLIFFVVFTLIIDTVAVEIMQLINGIGA